MQTSYSQAALSGKNGLLVYRESNIVLTRALGVAAHIGRFLTRNASDEKAKEPTSSGEVTSTGIGFMAWDPAREGILDASGNPSDLLPIGRDVPVLSVGFIVVYSETALAYGEVPCVRFTTATDGTDLGQIRSGTDSGKAVALPGARADETTSGAGLVRIRVAMGGGGAGSTGATGPTGPTGPTGA